MQKVVLGTRMTHKNRRLNMEDSLNARRTIGIRRLVSWSTSHYTCASAYHRSSYTRHARYSLHSLFREHVYIGTRQSLRTAKLGLYIVRFQAWHSTLLGTKPPAWVDPWGDFRHIRLHCWQGAGSKIHTVTLEQHGEQRASQCLL